MHTPKKFYVSGGDSGVIYIFNYANGRASLDREVKPDPGAGHVFLAGLAVHPATGTLYVCNEGGHEVWVLDPSRFSARKPSPWASIRTRAPSGATRNIST